MRFDRNSTPVGGQAVAAVLAAWRALALALATHFFGLRNRDDVHGRYRSHWMRQPDQAGGRVSPSYTTHSGPTIAGLTRHFEGRDPGDLVGLHVSSSDETCRWVVVDFDAHGEGDDPGANLRMALATYLAAVAIGLDPLLLDSNGKGGFHLWIVFARPIPMADAWRLGKWLVRDFAGFGLPKAPETFPKSPRLSGKRIGGWVRLPGRHHTGVHWTRVWDGERWLEGEAAIRAILNVTGRDGDLGVAIPPDFEPGGPRLASPRRTGGAGFAAEPSERRVATVREALGYLGDDHRDDYQGWLAVGMALRQLEDPGLELWHEWSRASAKYRPDVLDDKWSGLESDGENAVGSRITLGSLFHLAREAGWPGLSAKPARGKFRGSFNTPVRPLPPSEGGQR